MLENMKDDVEDINIEADVYLIMKFSWGFSHETRFSFEEKWKMCSIYLK